jgi:hypothetical protein
VIGQPAAAASKQLVSCIAGDMKAIEYVKPILNFIGRATIIVGEHVARGKSLVSPTSPTRALFTRSSATMWIFTDALNSVQNQAVCEHDVVRKYPGLLGGIRFGRRYRLSRGQAP